MQNKINLNFGPDKSQMLRAVAIVFMIILHNDTLPEFKICVPIFTFLVGYGYAFSKTKDLRHAIRRSWHLLSHFWLILLGICLPTAIWTGSFTPTLSDIAVEMFGLDSKLNWYSWYVYFYIYAMLAMIPASRIITRFRLAGTIILIAICYALTGAIHLVPGWSGNIWTQAIHDCLLCSPVMFSGFYLAEGGGITKIRIAESYPCALLCLLLAAAIFFLRGIPYMAFMDFITVPIFVASIVALFNIIKSPGVHRFMIAIGKESMNMWFLHALFATATTAMAFAPLLNWIEPKCLMIAAMISVSYLAARLTSAIYRSITE